MGPQQPYGCAGLSEVVILPETVPVCVGITDEPFRPDIIAVETNTAIGNKIREGYLYFCGGAVIFFKISIVINQLRRAGMISRSLNDFESNVKYGTRHANTKLTGAYRGYTDFFQYPM